MFSSYSLYCRRERKASIALPDCADYVHALSKEWKQKPRMTSALEQIYDSLMQKKKQNNYLWIYVYEYE